MLHFIRPLHNRLGRAVDRARILKELNISQQKLYFDESDLIVRRIAWMRFSVGLFIFAGLCVSLSIALIFIGVATKINLHNFVLITFITAMFSLIFGLLCFLKEIFLACKEVITCQRQDSNES